jgi:hypothetical protein
MRWYQSMTDFHRFMPEPLREWLKKSRQQVARH